MVETYVRLLLLSALSTFMVVSAHYKSLLLLLLLLLLWHCYSTNVPVKPFTRHIKTTVISCMLFYFT